MQIVCPSCTTSYDVAPTTLGDAGRSVRCVRCRNVWFATPVAELVQAMTEKPAGDGTRSAEFGQSLEQVPEGESPDDLSAETNPAQGATPPEDAVDVPSTAAETQIGENEAPPLVPALDADKVARPEPHPEPENIETVAARRAQANAKRAGWKLPRWKLPQWKLPRWGLPRWPRRLAWPGMPATIAVLAVAVAGLIVWRTEVVRAVPQSASLFSTIGLPVNLRGLVFENVRTTGELHEGVPVLIIEGSVANVAGKSVEVPRLRFAMRNRAGHEVYAWTSVTGRSVLAPGESAAFRTRLASPPADGRDVIVRFFTRRDFLAGMR